MGRPLDGKVALVTGGQRGIGAAVCRLLARDGCHVAVVDRAGAEAAAPVVAAIEAEGRRALALTADVADFGAAERCVAETLAAFGRLDVLVCNAGITRDAVLWKMTEAQWDSVLDVNLKGYFNYIRAASEPMRAARAGKIVTVASINGIRGKFGQGNYAAAKAGAIALTKTAARELGKFNVNVNCVAPGMVATEMAGAIPKEFLEAALRETVLGRIAAVDDVAEVVCFLCGDAARHVTGEVIKVDGGQLM